MRFELVVDAGRNIKMEFVRIKAARFTMQGNHFTGTGPYEVTLTRDFWLQTTETTEAQWQAVMGESPSRKPSAHLPVTMVSWDDCQEFLRRLAKKSMGQLQGRTPALPTVAEWKYACTMGRESGHGFGRDSEWYQENSGGAAHPVGLKKPNAWGLYDMYGNVGEWAHDWDGPENRNAATDPTGPKEGTARRVCGGAWYN